MSLCAPQVETPTLLVVHSEKPDNSMQYLFVCLKLQINHDGREEMCGCKRFKGKN
jgi:hypothetical protein